MPTISIIIPNYNHAPYLKQRMDSIFNQTYQDFEVILLDDYSTDNSLEIIKEYLDNPKIACLVVNEKNSGSSFNQWIKGIELARGNHIWIAESDDIADENFLGLAVNALQNKKCILFFSQSYIIDEKGKIKALWNDKFASDNSISGNLDGKELIQKYMINANVIPNASAVVFKKEFLNSKIKEDIITYKINGDWFLWINLLMKGNCLFISEPLNYFRRHKGAGSPKNVANFKNIEEAFRINIFLKKNGFKINGKNWLKVWLGQANFSFKILFNRNFINIYKFSFCLFPFPFSYLFYGIIYHKISNLKVKFRL